MNLKNSFLHPILNGIIFLLVMWLGGLLLFAQDVQDTGGIDPTVKAGGIVVLTGGTERLPAGLDLLQNGFAPKLLISGVDPRVEAEKLIGDHPAKSKLKCCITLGTLAEDTHGNAQETAGWVKNSGITNLIVVTSNYHMRRALLELHQAMPHVHLFAYAVNPASAHMEEWWAYAGTASLLMEEYNKLLLAYVKAAIHKVISS